MTVAVPNVYTKDAEEDTFRSNLKAFAELVQDNATHWSIDEWNMDGDDIESLLLRQGDQQVLIWYEEKESEDDEVHVAMDPEGQILDSTNPEASASDEWTGLLTRAVDGNWNGGIDEGHQGFGCSFVELEDAFFWLGNGAEGGVENHFWNGLHAGIIFNPFFPNDPQQGMTGHGIVFGRTQGGSSLNRSWFRSNTSRIRVAWGTWHGAGEDNPSSTTTFLGRRRMVPLLMDDNDESIDIGLYRYMSYHSSSEDPMIIVPDKNTDQGWIYFNYHDSGSRYSLIWNKTVIP